MVMKKGSLENLIEVKKQKEVNEVKEGNNSRVRPLDSKYLTKVRKQAGKLSIDIQTPKSYNGFPADEKAIGVLCGYSGKKFSEMTENECLYLEGAIKGLQYNIDKNMENTQESLDSNYLEKLQKEMLSEEWQEYHYKSEEGCIGLRIDVAQSYSIIARGEGSSCAGYREWCEQCNDWNKNENKEWKDFMKNIFRDEKEKLVAEKINTKNIYNIGEKIGELQFRKREENLLRKVAKYFFELCDQDIREIEKTRQVYSDSEDTRIRNEKLHVIARTVNWLGKGQFLKDGNSRVTAYGVLPGLLLKYGLEPAMIEDSRIFKERSTCEIYGAIRYGQERFKYYKDEYLNYIEENDTFVKEAFEEKFNQKRKEGIDRFESKGEYSEKNPIKKAFTTYRVNELMKESKEEISKNIRKISQKIDEISQKIETGALDAEKEKAKIKYREEIMEKLREIDTKIDNVFIDRYYKVGAGYAALDEVNTTLTKSYATLASNNCEKLTQLSEAIQKSFAEALKNPSNSLSGSPDSNASNDALHKSLQVSLGSSNESDRILIDPSSTYRNDSSSDELKGLNIKD